MVKANETGADSLTLEEDVRLSFWYTAVLLRMQNQFNDYRLGFLDEDMYQAALDAAAASYDLWMELGVDIEDSEFKAAIESVRKIRANSE